jgi:AcrR family transcriptional regulator
MSYMPGSREAVLSAVCQDIALPLVPIIQKWRDAYPDYAEDILAFVMAWVVFESHGRDLHLPLAPLDGGHAHVALDIPAEDLDRLGDRIMSTMRRIEGRIHRAIALRKDQPSLDSIPSA